MLKFHTGTAVMNAYASTLEGAFKDSFEGYCSSTLDKQRFESYA